jgi:hypothetical protein
MTKVDQAIDALIAAFDESIRELPSRSADYDTLYRAARALQRRCAEAQKRIHAVDVRIERRKTYTPRPEGGSPEAFIKPRAAHVPVKKERAKP